MNHKTSFRIAVLPGDGIGIEVIDAALEVLNAVEQKIGGFRLQTETLPAGAGHYRDTGVALPEDTLRAAEQCDAILLGAMGLPEVRYPDGTEISPQLDLRFHFGLFAGVRPVRTYANGPGV
ncbi:MAG: isocitrate/isopropylmalate family dehydrogenase, partial [Chloroflexi bacterium]|nr:isocitrate/isopropylmalate family dehydrogenase [Chloroflexota bacterium]